MQMAPMLPETPNPPESSSLPSRHRPTLGNLAQDTTELDLWAFDDEIVSETTSAEPRIPKPSISPSRQSGEIPVLTTPTPVPAFERIRRNIAKPKPATPQLTPSRSASSPEENFEDLEQWEEPAPEPAAPASSEPAEAPQPVQTAIPVAVETVEATLPDPSGSNTKAPAEDPLPSPPPAASTPSPANPPAEKEVAVSSTTSAPRLGTLEWVLLGGFALIMLSVLGWLLSISVFSLPRERQHLGSADFPVKGGILQVQAGTTFWRTPRSGIDVVRRGTQLIPVARLQFGSGSGQIRVIFADADGKTVGDAFTLSVKDNEIHEFAATAGFDDIGMYASYRTGGSKPWTVRVFEAPAGNSRNPDFRKLVEMDISPDRRDPTP